MLCLFVVAVPGGFAEPTNSPPFPLYLQIQMGADHKTPAFIHFFGRISREPWILPHQNITEKGLFPGAHGGMVQKDDHTLAAGDQSPWVDIAPLLSTNGVNFVELSACTNYQKLLPTSGFTVLVSSTASKEGLLKSFTRRGTGAGMHFTVDLANRQDIRSDLEWSREAKASADALPSAPGKRPRAFPVQTGCFTRPEMHSEEVVRNELDVLTKLGFSGLTATPRFIESGFIHPNSHITYWHFRQDHCINALDMDKVRRYLTASAEELKKKGVADNLLYVSLMDEPSSPRLDHIAKCPHCIEKFPEFLKAQGLKPSDFGKQDWSEVRPSEDSEKEPRLYYYSFLFRHWSLANYFKVGTDILHETLPSVPTTVNFAESLTYYGNLIHRGTDWFEILRSGGLTYGWNEDWLPFNASPQLCGYHADFLRSACKYRGQAFGYYTILQRPHDTELKAVTEIGHGAQAIFHYNYGPYYTGASDADSQKYERYPSLQRVNHAIGGAEDFLVDAKVPPSKVALHYSLATDIWRFREPWSLYGRERSYIYLIFRHLGYPVDILTEDDIIEGRLKDYEFLVLLGSHLKREVVPRLADWVNKGGILYVGAGTGTHDEFNASLKTFNDAFGLHREDMVMKQSPGRAELEGWRLEKLDTVRFGKSELEAVCATEKLSKQEGAQDLATFSDGSPALQMNAIGKGKLILSGFFPGCAYVKTSSLARKELWDRLEKEKKDRVTNAPPSYPENIQAIFAKLLDQIPYRPPVRLSHPLVEANLLRSEKGDVIALANWSGEPQKNLNLIATGLAASGQPRSVCGSLKNVQREKSDLILSVDLDTIDFIVLQKSQDE